MPFARRLRLGGVTLAAGVLLLGANLVSNHGAAAVMEIGGGACLLLAGAVASSAVLWAVIGLVEVGALVLIWMHLRLAFAT